MSESSRTPVPSSTAVSDLMQRMGRENTAPELALRKALTRLGLRYRLHRRDLPGTPDIVFVTARVAVFVDGCFWHACPEHGVAPRANSGWWSDKLAANRERDARNDEALRESGWLPIRVWEHEDPALAAVSIEAQVSGRPGPQASTRTGSRPRDPKHSGH
jgi:DNA mismatch endonuclease (patch repair protein)